MVNGWLNGVPCDRIAMDDRAVLFGDSCFTTVAIRAGQPELWSRHRERLQQTVERLKFPLLDLSRLDQEVMTACRGIARGILRVTLSRGSGGRGYGLPTQAQLQRLLLQREWPLDIETRARDGITARWCDTPIASQPLLAGLKHGNRLEQVLARAEWQGNDIAEGLMCDYSGHVIEGTTSNLFFCNPNGQWCTPALSQCGVAGVMRAELLSQLKADGEMVHEGNYMPADLKTATEVLVCNSVIGIWPICTLADWHWPIGPRTRVLQHAIGRLDAEGRWL